MGGRVSLVRLKCGITTRTCRSAAIPTPTAHPAVVPPSQLSVCLGMEALIGNGSENGRFLPCFPSGGGAPVRPETGHQYIGGRSVDGASQRSGSNETAGVFSPLCWSLGGRAAAQMRPYCFASSGVGSKYKPCSRMGSGSHPAGSRPAPGAPSEADAWGGWAISRPTCSSSCFRIR